MDQRKSTPLAPEFRLPRTPDDIAAFHIACEDIPGFTGLIGRPDGTFAVFGGEVPSLSAAKEIVRRARTFDRARGR